MTEKSIALGTFDGFHLGHRAVLELAKSSKHPAYILLFSQHPLSIINGKAPSELLSWSIREKLVDDSGLSPLLIDFKQIYNLSAEDFFFDILVNRFNAKELSCGENYTFGKGGKGNTELLSRLCSENGVTLNIAKTVKFNGETVSSTKIRNYIESGDIPTANAMLGRAFSYDFTVVSGDRRGRLLGFPTINQFFPDNFVRMKYGVYASYAVVDGKHFPAVTNFGVRPTIGTDSVRSETCILGFSGNLYGRNIEVSVLQYLRPETKFGSLDELTRAIRSDAEKSSEIFNNSIALLG